MASQTGKQKTAYFKRLSPYDRKGPCGQPLVLVLLDSLFPYLDPCSDISLTLLSLPP